MPDGTMYLVMNGAQPMRTVRVLLRPEMVSDMCKGLDASGGVTQRLDSGAGRGRLVETKGVITLDVISRSKPLRRGFELILEEGRDEYYTKIYIAKDVFLKSQVSIWKVIERVFERAFDTAVVNIRYGIMVQT